MVNDYLQLIDSRKFMINGMNINKNCEGILSTVVSIFKNRNDNNSFLYFFLYHKKTTGFFNNYILVESE